ncbi:MAG: hypothetical protein IPK60_01890 [Sandaracinaceae bacterium]|nr:hypothetical protein [Sandaracinaceae bacterium]
MKLRVTFLLAFALFVVGCAESTELTDDGGVAGGADAGPRNDSGMSADLGASVDLGAPVDSGASVDLGASIDAGPTPVDAGSTMDSGTPGTDSGLARPDGAILPPVDAGNPFGDAGALGEPAWVPVDVRTSGSCDALTACGGELVGTWDVTSACIALPLGTLTTACPAAMITYAGGMARGRTTFDATTVSRLAQSQVEVDMFVPASCATFVGGCTAVAGFLSMAAPDSTCIDDGDGNCNCAARQVSDIDNTDTYTRTDTEIVTGGGKTYEYCRTDDSFTYQDTTAGSAMSREPGIITLGMR